MSDWDLVTENDKLKEELKDTNKHLNIMQNAYQSLLKDYYAIKEKLKEQDDNN